MLGRNVLKVMFMEHCIMLLIFDIHSHNVEKMFLEQHSQNVLMMLFVLDKHSKKRFITFK